MKKKTKILLIILCILLIIFITFVILNKTLLSTNIEKKCNYTGQLKEGAEFIEGDYTYRYMQEYTHEGWKNSGLDGWGVTLTDKNIKELSSNICNTIGNKKIVSASYMFSNAENLSSIDLSSFDTSNISNMEYMFYKTGYSADTLYINLNNFNTSKVTNMQSMFELSGHKAVEYKIDGFNNFITKNVKYFNNMFYYSGYNSYNYNLGDLSSWTFENAINMNNMFYSAGRNSTNFTIGNISKWTIPSTTVKYNIFTNTGEKSNYTFPTFN